MRRRSALLPVAALWVAASCGSPPPAGPVAVSVVGKALASGDARRPVTVDDGAAAVLALATRGGLVRFDAAGQVAPALAGRWSIADGGRALLFRLPEGASDAAAVARSLRAAMAPAAGNRLAPLLGAVRSVDAITPQVIDIELSAPRPNLLPLFAQPDLAVAPAGAPGAPFALARLVSGIATLRPRTGLAQNDRAPPPDVTLRGERAANAVARFAAGRTDLVLGGRLPDLPVALAAELPAGRLRLDPAPGLLGLAFAASGSGLAATADGRAALAMAVDRDRIAATLGIPGWVPRTALVPAGLPEIDAPAAPGWVRLSLEGRRAVAAAAVRARRTAAGSAPPLRVAMPPGPGARLLLALLVADWRTIGVAAVAVGMDEPADLRFVDEAAPADTAAFYLRRFACARGVPCTAAADAAMIAARRAPTLAMRGALFARADAAIAETVPFILLGPPVRWSLVAPALVGFRDSPRAIHPLDDLVERSAR